MENIKFRTPYNHKNFPKSYEKLSDVSLTERAGYIPPKIRIEQMLLAGLRLQQSRLEQFDFEGDVDETFIDPTRSKGYDITDAQKHLESIKPKKVEKKPSDDGKQAAEKSAAKEEKTEVKSKDDNSDKEQS